MDHDHTSVARLPSFTGPYPASETSTWLHLGGIEVGSSPVKRMDKNEVGFSRVGI